MAEPQRDPAMEALDDADEVGVARGLRSMIHGLSDLGGLRKAATVRMLSALPERIRRSVHPATAVLDGTRMYARERIEAALDHQLVHVWPFDDVERADLVLDAGPTGVWTVHASGGRVTFKVGRARRPTSTVYAHASTLIDVLEGTRSGVSAWLERDLVMRGNIGLALKLEGLLRGPNRPANFPKPGRVYAHGIDTFYLEAGQGDPVVLLHGLGSTNSGMLPTLDDLGRDYRVLSPDIPGFGDSAKPIRSYHARFFARWLIGFLDALGIQRAHLIGNSMGGRIALEVALRAPERVDRLVLLAPAVALKKVRQFVPIVKLLQPEIAFLPLFARRAHALFVTRSLFADSTRIDATWHEAAADEFLRVFGTARGRIAFFSALREIYLDVPHGPSGFWTRLASLSPPALFLWGDRDPLVPAKFARHVERALPDATSIVLPDCGHVPHFEYRAQTHRLIRDFLAGSSGDPGVP